MGMTRPSPITGSPTGISFGMRKRNVLGFTTMLLHTLAERRARLFFLDQ